MHNNIYYNELKHLNKQKNIKIFKKKYQKETILIEFKPDFCFNNKIKNQ